MFPQMKMSRIRFYFFLFSVPLCFVIFSCKKDVKSFTYAHFDLQFSGDQERLNDTGGPAIVPAGHAAQTPVMNGMSVNYIELSTDSLMPYKGGAIIYKAPETFSGGQLSINFDSAVVASTGEDFYRVNINKIMPGTYRYVRVSVAHQDCSLTFNLRNIPTVGDLFDQNGNLAAFTGYRTYIGKLTILGLSINVYADKEQGYWAFATGLTGTNNAYNAIYTGQCAPGATTVVNPISLTSPIPAGSGVVTGKFTEPLIITGEEADDTNAEDLFIHLSFSVNQSFEWNDTDGNGQWDIDAASSEATEQVTDTGVRGLSASWEWLPQ